MNMIDEIKNRFKLEIRPNSEGSEYLEAVLDAGEFGGLSSFLGEHLGPIAKEAGKEAKLPGQIVEIVEAIGGLRNDQSFFYRLDGDKLTFAAIWPWATNPKKMTLKSGICELSSGD
jgi:hypothetical protein